MTVGNENIEYGRNGIITRWANDCLNARGRITTSYFIYVANFSSIEYKLHTPHNKTNLTKSRIWKFHTYKT